MIDELNMPNWSRIVHGRVAEGQSRISLLLKEIAEKLESETALLLAPSAEKPEVWTIPKGWVYSEKEFPIDLSISDKSDIVKRTLSEESVVLDAKLEDAIPEALARLSIESAIAVAVGYPRREALLLICNSKKLVGRPPFQVSYTKADGELAMVMARVISMDGVGKFIHKKIAEVKPMVEESHNRDAWSREKGELLRTHSGWFVAYQDGKRVALESSLDRLVAAIDEKLGTPRRPCEFYEVVEQPAVERGPSPRLWPAYTGK